MEKMLPLTIALAMGAMIFALIFFIVIAGQANAGGGPGPECGVYLLEWSGAAQGNAGGHTYLHVSNHCPATVTVEWHDGSVTVVDIPPLPDLSGYDNEVAIFVPEYVTPDIYTISFDSTDGISSYHNEKRLKVGDLPVMEVILTLSVSNPYWASYPNYTSGILSIDETLSNAGINDAYAAWYGDQTSAGVVPYGNSRYFVDKLIPAGESRTFMRFYLVSPGTGRFTITAGAQAEDPNANIHTFGSLPPEV